MAPKTLTLLLKKFRPTLSQGNSVQMEIAITRLIEQGCREETWKKQVWAERETGLRWNCWQRFKPAPCGAGTGNLLQSCPKVRQEGNGLYLDQPVTGMGKGAYSWVRKHPSAEFHSQRWVLGMSHQHSTLPAAGRMHALLKGQVWVEHPSSH